MKIAFQGYTGKMGSVVYKKLLEYGYEIVDTFDAKTPFEGTLKSDIEVIVDFSTIEMARKIVEYGILHHVPVITGTTGFSVEEKERLNNLAKENQVGVYIVANFLLSITALKEFLKHLNDIYDKIYIDEIHHESKVDAPSGTAYLLAESIDENKLQAITYKRASLFLYEHKIFLANSFETLEISHRVFDKNGYALGVIRAIKNISSFIGVKDSI